MAELIPLEDAQKIVLDNVKLMDEEQIAVLDAIGRVASRDLASDIDINGFDDAAMDGFALIAADIADASPQNPVELKIMDVVGAGYLYAGELQSGQAVRIMTGAAMPIGADTNAKIEDVQVTGQGLTGDTVIFTAPLAAGTSVRKAGEEAKKGQVVFHCGEVINPAGVGLLASTGNTTVPVFKRPRVGVMSIGSELVDSNDVPGMGMKRDSNRYTLSAMAIDAGASVTMYPIVPDDPDAIAQQYARATAECDVVVSSGGACGGDFDYISQVIHTTGDVKFEYVNMRPGKAQTFGVAPDGTLLFGLSGNPAACATGFEVLVRPALLKAQGHTQLHRPTVMARLVAPVKIKDTRRCLLRARIDKDDDGQYVATPLKGQSSAIIGATSHSNCYIVVVEGSGVPEVGSLVQCIRIDLPEGTVC